MRQRVFQVIKTKYKGKLAYLSVMDKRQMGNISKFSKSIRYSKDIAIISAGSDTTINPIDIKYGPIQSKSDIGLLTLNSEDMKIIQIYNGRDTEVPCLFVK